MAEKGAFRLPTAVKYILSLSVALALLWWVMRGMSLSSFLTYLEGVNWYWVVVSMILAILSHAIRAYRWQLQYQPLNYRVSFSKSFIAVWVGYLVNLILPRAGEIARCTFLQRKSGVPISTSIGTVISERLIDVLLLFGCIGLVFLFEVDALATFMEEQLQGKLSSVGLKTWLVLGAIGLGMGGLSFVYLLWKGWSPLLRIKLLVKARPLLIKVIEGVFSIRKLHRPLAFWVSSLLIWGTYYAMTYAMVLSFPATQALLPSAGLTILVMGGFGMAAPVQGGLGAYHLLVSNLLLIYAIDKQEGLAFATLLHTSQTLLVIGFGGIAFLIGIFIPNHTHDSVPGKDSATGKSQSHDRALASTRR